MSDIIKRVMHPFTYRMSSTHEYVRQGIRTGMNPRDFGRFVVGVMKKLGVDSKRITAEEAFWIWKLNVLDHADEDPEEIMG